MLNDSRTTRLCGKKSRLVCLPRTCQRWASSDLFSVISGLNMKTIQLFIQDASPGLKNYAAIMAKTQLEREEQYEDALKSEKTSRDLAALVPVSGRLQAPKPIEKPLPANAVALYHPDIFGLEDAARDCRFEMIKIVREVRQPPQHSLALDVLIFFAGRCSHKRSQSSLRPLPHLPVSKPQHIQVAPSCMSSGFHLRCKLTRAHIDAA